MTAATNLTPGEILIGGDLAPNTTGSAPELRATGVTPGTYSFSSIVVDNKGRLVFAKSASEEQLSVIDLPDATDTVKGKVSINTLSGLSVQNGIVFMRHATSNEVGGVILGSGIATDGTSINVTIPLASTTTFGRMQVGNNLSISSDTVFRTGSNPTTTTALGIVRPGNIDTSGFAVDGGLLRAQNAGTLNHGVIQADPNSFFFFAPLDALRTHRASDFIFGRWPTDWVAEPRLTVSSDATLSFDNVGYLDNVPIASASILGKVRVGAGLNIDSSTGILSLSGLQAATTLTLGTVITGNGFFMDENILRPRVVSDLVYGIYTVGSDLETSEITAAGETQNYVGLRMQLANSNMAFGVIKRAIGDNSLSIIDGEITISDNIPKTQNEVNVFTQTQASEISSQTASTATTIFDADRPIREITLTADTQFILGNPAGYIPGTVSKIILKKNNNARTFSFANEFKLNEEPKSFLASQQLIITIICVTSSLFLVIQGDIYNI